MPSQNLQTITLGGGCFWCTEAVFDRVRGVTDVQSGYSNGQTVKPSYEQVCTGKTGHNEVVRVTFDPEVIGLHQILQIFFATHDPTTLNRRGNYVGTQDRSRIYFRTPEQEQAAKDVLQGMERVDIFAGPITPEVVPVASYSDA